MSVDGERSLTPAGAFGFLLGEWRVTREVSGMASMAGTLDVQQRSEGDAAYVERMQVRTEGGAAFAGSTGYIVRRTSEGFDLQFPETEVLFQRVVFSVAEGGGLRAAAVHHCGADRYESSYVLGPTREMTVQHVVTGPRKKYVSVARFVGVSHGSAVDGVRGNQDIGGSSLRSK